MPDWKPRHLPWANEIMYLKKDLLSSHHLPSYPQLSISTISEQTKTTTGSHSWLQCRENVMVGAQPLQLHLYHSCCICDSENIKEEGTERLVRA